MVKLVFNFAENSTANEVANEVYNKFLNTESVNNNFY